MAFHLHRLGLVGRALREAGYNVHDAADLAAGRSALSSVRTSKLAEQLGIAVQQLTRELSDEETRSWSFYRRAASDPQHVWAKARSAWQAANVTDQLAAQIMRIHRGNIVHSRSKPERSVLTFEQAARLTTALSIPEGPEVFLQIPNSNDPHRAR